jgi:hypothetical protein
VVAALTVEMLAAMANVPCQWRYFELLESVVDHLLYNVLPAAADYDAAEMTLSLAYASNSSADSWAARARDAKRHAANLAIAIDGLTDRCAPALGLSLSQVRDAIPKFCVWPGTELARPGCIERVRAIANAYKHAILRPEHPISSERAILVVGSTYGIDCFGVGKFGGVEVIVTERSGEQWKFLGDAPVAIVAWFRFLRERGALLPDGPFQALGLQVHP